MAITVSLINMKGGVGKTTLTFNLAWYCYWKANMRVLAIDLDPQSNLSQYLMGKDDYSEKILKTNNQGTVVDIFEKFSVYQHSPPLSPDKIIYNIEKYSNDNYLHLVPSRLELSLALKNPTYKDQLLSKFVNKIEDNYDLILIDCAPTESILTTAAYCASQYVVVPVRPEPLSIVGLPLLARSLEEHRTLFETDTPKMAGIILNGKQKARPTPTQLRACNEVDQSADEYGWYIFINEMYHSDSYPSSCEQNKPIFKTKNTKENTKTDFDEVAQEFLEIVGWEE